MKRIFFIPLFILSCLAALSQDYIPAKETAADISPYKAVLLLDSAFGACKGHFYYHQNNFVAMNDLSYKITPQTILLSFKTWNGMPREISMRVDQMEMPVVTNVKKEGTGLRFLPADNSKYFAVDGGVYILQSNKELCKRVADAIFILKTKDRKVQEAEDGDEIKSFEPIALKYRTLVIKPEAKESARIFLVQAATAAEEKHYFEAIGLLGSATLDDPSYPQAHFNAALLWGAGFGIWRCHT